MKIQITQKQESTSGSSFLTEVKSVLQNVTGIKGRVTVYTGDYEVHANWMGGTNIIVGLDEKERMVVNLHHNDKHEQQEFKKIPSVREMENILDSLLDLLIIN